MFKILSVILKRKKYLAIFAVVAVIVFGILYYLTVLSIANNSILIYAIMSGTSFTIASLFLSAVTALLLGVHISLMVFRHDIIKKISLPDKATSFGGTATGLVAAGCPTCGAPVLGLLGYPLGLFALPFGGLELKILSIALLFLAVYLISKNIKKTLVCKINN